MGWPISVYMMIGVQVHVSNPQQGAFRMCVIRIPPPVWTLLFIILAFGIHRLYPWRELVDVRSPLAAVLLAGLGIGVAVWARSLFVAANTTLVPASPVNNALVVEGPYRFSRNPMYLSLVMIALGVAFYVGTTPMFLAPVGVFLLCDGVFIPFEEAKMLRQFGETYAAYTHRVRRWI